MFSIEWRYVYFGIREGFNLGETFFILLTNNLYKTNKFYPTNFLFDKLKMEFSNIR